MDRRAVLAAIGGAFAATATQAQTVFDPVGGLLAVPGAVLGTGAGVVGGGLGVLGGGLGVQDGFAARDLMGGEYAIETSRIALSRSRNRAIRDFAESEIEEQMSVTAALGAAPGSVPPRPDQAAIVRRLAAMRAGPAFDRAYVRGQIAGHEELLANNMQAVSSAADPTVRRVATLSLPTIQAHIAILHRLRAGLGSV